MMKKILYFLCILLYINCNMLFYKKNEPEPYLSFIKDNYFGEILLKWEEKLPHPLSGTTLKRNYETEISIIQFQNIKNAISKKILKSLTFKNWILPESIYVLSIEPISLIFFYGEKPEDYGIKKSLGYYYEEKSEYNQLINTANLFSLDNIKFFLPSPDRNFIFMLTYNDKIQVYQINQNHLILQKEVSLPFRISDERFISWDPENYKGVYIYNNDQIYLYDINKNNINIAKKFPECIIPGTSFGGNIDSIGNQYLYDREKKQYYVISLKYYQNFYKKKLIDNPHKIRFSCY
ncbi:MAG: hypothetical protein KatS3mg129_2118 [Leptospiraceae bacterium]|nr:MAG: hypothetical protein KatS3mg129_2118 [Leptospiraceae bacterium]